MIPETIQKLFYKNLTSKLKTSFETIFELFYDTRIYYFIIPSINITMDFSQVPDYEDSDEEKVCLNNFKGAKDVQANFAGWNELYLKDQLKKAVRQIGFEYPSEVQKTAIPIIMNGKDLICQARSGMGKTAVFIIGVLNQIATKQGQYIPFNCLVITHTRQLAHQVFKDFRRFGRYFKEPELRIACFFGGLQINSHRQQLQDKHKLPHIVIGTPGRLKSLIRQNLIETDKIQYFIIDECDHVLSDNKMIMTIQSFFKNVSTKKQVLMFSATMPEHIVKQAQKFMISQQHIFIDIGKLLLTGLSQFKILLYEKDKMAMLVKLLDDIKFDQVVIFVNKVERAKRLTSLLEQKLFNPICLHSDMSQPFRIMNYDKFRGNHSRLLVATDLFGRGIDVERVNLVINYDIPLDVQSYLHRVGRAGRFNTKGIAINFVRRIGDSQQEDLNKKDVQTMKQIQQGIHNQIPELPQNFDSRLYI